jgi:putative ABC transport system permease protein
MLELRHAIRFLWRARAFTTLAVLVLGLGIAASTTMFSVLNGVLLRPLPYHEPSRLVAVWETSPTHDELHAGVSAFSFETWRTRNTLLGGVAAYRNWGFEIAGGSEPERLRGARVSANLFSLLGVLPVLGRAFVAGEDQPGQPDVVMVSEELWRRRFGGDRALLGTTLDLNGRLHTVVGIVGKGFVMPEADVFVPLVFAPYELAQHGNRSLTVIARLGDGATTTAAGAELRRIAGDLAQAFPDAYADWSVGIDELQADLGAAARGPLLLLFAATCLVLFAACGNLAGLLVARSNARRQEIALRAALGAGRARLVRQIVTENAVVVTAAAIGGLALAALATGLVERAASGWLPPGTAVAIDPLVVGFVLLASAVAVVVLSLAPAAAAGRVDLAHVIKAGSPGVRARWGAVSARDIPLMSQVALALLLLIGGGLLLRSFARLQNVPLGFEPRRIASLTLSLPGTRYGEPERRAAFYQDLENRLDVVPGVRSAALASQVPLSGGPLMSDLLVEGQAEPGPSGPSVNLVNVTPRYFATLGIEVVAGRSLVASDRTGAPPVVVIDQSLARLHWPAGDAVGKRIRLGTTLGADTAWREVVGVVVPARTVALDRAPAPTVYVPHAQNPWPSMNVLLSTQREPTTETQAAIGVIRRLDPSRPVYNVRNLDGQVRRQLAPRRVQVLLMSGFAVAALALAVLAVYGALAYAVGQRTREIGIRVALGAERATILWLCMRQTLGRLAIGLGVGAGIALLGVRWLRTLLFELEPWDLPTFTGALVLVVVAALAASAVPAWRAARLDPLDALRRE